MPLITTAVMTALITTIANKGLDTFVENSSEKISDGAINWIKDLLFKKGKPKIALRELTDNPLKKESQEAVKAIIENSIEDNNVHLEYLKEIIEALPIRDNIVTASKNVNTGNINTSGGNIHIGDKYGE